MNTPRVRLSQKDIERAVFNSPVVRAGLRMRADRVLGRARSEALRVGARRFAESLRREGGTRPGTKSPTGIKRPYERVIATSEDASDQEYGNVGVSKQAILRRSAGA